MAFDTWSERRTLETRITSLADNQARWTDADPKNDPELAFHSASTCVMCHAR